MKRLILGLGLCVLNLASFAEEPIYSTPYKDKEADAKQMDNATFALQKGAYDVAYHSILPLAEKGYPQAQNYLGYMYAHGEGVRRNIREGLKWYYRAAMQNLPEAQYNLGYMFEQGKGVRKNNDIAFKWYLKAAQQGHAKAQNSIGTCYEKGSGIEQSNRLAATWYLKAAEQRLTEAEFHLGSIFYHGKNVKKDLVEAYKWFYLASASNKEESVEMVRDVMQAREMIVQEMTAEQLQTAQNAAYHWAAKYPLPPRPVPKGQWKDLGSTPTP